MRVHVVSDVHGNADALARAGDGADALVVLGDLLDFVDYYDHGKGILGAVFGAGEGRGVRRAAPGRQSANLAAYARSLWAGLDNAADVVEEAIRDQYAKLFAAMTRAHLRDAGQRGRAGAVAGVRRRRRPRSWTATAVGVGGLRFGVRRRRAARARADAEADRRVGAVSAARARTSTASGRRAGPVDVLCSHIPPAVPELCYDVVARRFGDGVHGAAGRDPPAPAALVAVRARAPAAGAADADRPHRVRQRRTLQADRARRTCCAGE